MLTVWLVEALNTFFNDLFKNFRTKETFQRKGEQFNVSCKQILGYKSLLRFDIVVNTLMSALGHMGKSMIHQPPRDTDKNLTEILDVSRWIKKIPHASSELLELWQPKYLPWNINFKITPMVHWLPIRWMASVSVTASPHPQQQMHVYGYSL